jgi:hypothetical protein
VSDIFFIRGLPARIAAAGLVFLGFRAGPIAQVAPPQLTVRVYDAVRVPANTRRSVEAQAAAILKDAGIAVVWRDCLDDLGGCVAPLGPTEIAVRLVTSPSHVVDQAHASDAMNLVRDDQADSLGYSVVDVKEGRGWLATIFVDRVDRAARAANSNSSRLFGQVIAHEIGHLLLGRSTHAARGLMRSRWTTDEMRREAPWDWLVLRSEAGEMRRSLADWSRQATPPILVTADDITADDLDDDVIR